MPVFRCIFISVFNLQTSLPNINGNSRHERPIWIWDLHTAGFVWANGEGVKFWAAPSLESLQATPFDKSHPAWLKVCQILDGLSPTNIHSDQAIGVNLYFPHMNGGAQAFQKSSTNKISAKSAPESVSVSFEKKDGSKSNEGHFIALCRRGSLKNRTALIVEVISVTGNKTTEHRNSLSDTPTSSEIPSEHAPSQNGALPDFVDINSPLEDEEDEANSDFPAGLSSSFMEELGVKELIPKAQLKELARLIKEAGGNEQDVLKAESSGLSPSSLKKHYPEAVEQKHYTENASSVESTSVVDSASNMSLKSSQDKWSPLEIDLTALAGVGDQEELEQLFEAAQAPYALISLQKIIHANGSFVSEFGYDDIDPLINDGADWLFPKSRDTFSTLIAGEIGSSTTGATLGLESIRLRSGRKLSRDVLITPVRLTKFDRTLLLIQLANDFNFSEKPTFVDYVQEPPSQLSQTFDTNSETTSIPLLSAVSHEVRTPLNVILGFSEVMALEQFGPLGNEKYKDYIQDIHNSAQHALSLINDLLDLTKLKAGKWHVEPAEVEINTVVRDQVRLMRELAAQRQVRLRSDLEENLPQVHVDERSLQQILLNLISNGIKYDHEGGLITVQTVLQDEDTLILTVSDTGPGMSKDDIRHAMEPFHQVINMPFSSSTAVNPAFISGKKGKSGTGLGLPISKALAEANGIGFTIDSQQDRGTKVTLTFKVTAP